jgi:hypothetical protein
MVKTIRRNGPSPKMSGHKWKRPYPMALLADVVLILEQRPDLPYQQVLEWACGQYGIAYVR